MGGIDRFMTHRPMCLAAASFALGAAVGCTADVPAMIWSLELVLCGVCFLPKRHVIWIYCALLAAGAWSCAALTQIEYPLPDRAGLSGCIYEVNEVTGEYTTLTIDRVYLDGKAYPSKVRLTLYEQTGAAPGMKIECDARLWKPSGQTNPGGFDYDLYLRRRGVHARASAQSATLKGEGAGFRFRIDDLRQKIGMRIDRLFGNQAPFVRAVVLGDRSELSGEVYKGYQNAGIVHLLAISGLHITCLAAAVSALLKRMRMGRIVTGVISVCLCSAYAVLVGGTASVLRAVCMFAVLNCARWSGGAYDSLTGLSIAALLILAGNPLNISDTGFILSFTAVLGILFLYAPLTRGARTDHWPKKTGKIGKMLCVSVSAQLGILPAACCIFGQVSVYGMLFNLIGVPVCTLTVPLSMLAVALDAVFTPFGELLAWISTVLIRIMDGAALWSENLPGAVLTFPAWPWTLTVLFAAAGLTASDYTAWRRPIKRCAWACMPVILLASVLIAQMRIPSGLNVLFLDAGDADAAIVTADGRTYLVDTGENSAAAEYLMYTGRNVDGIFISHAHQDHAGGLKDILENRFVPDIYLPEGFYESGVSGDIEETIERARQQGTKVHCLSRGDCVMLSEKTEAQALAPEIEGEKTDNGASMVLLVSRDQGSVLFTGDLPAARESPYLRHADLLKAAHHGSDDANSEFLLRVVQPRVCVIPAGPGSGHPSPAVLQRLEEKGIVTFVTGTSGAVSADILSDGTLEMETFL